MIVEHEIDYILFIRATDITLDPNPDEVAETRFVTREELSSMMDSSSGLKWSPWFRIIADQWLQCWWSDLDGALCGHAKHIDWQTIHKIM